MKVKDFPKEIKERMMDCQEEQGNKRDFNAFIPKCDARKYEGGFNWEDTKEGDDFWDDIIHEQEFSVFYEKYPKKEEQSEQDNVNRPSHYTSGGIECIDAMIAAYGKEAVMHFCQCNAFKYQWRFDKKNGDEDLKKEMWYINKYLELKECK